MVNVTEDVFLEKCPQGKVFLDIKSKRDYTTIWNMGNNNG